MAADQNAPLPGLRQDLQLLEGAYTVAGRPTWLVFDPVLHRYFQIDQAGFRLLGLWSECQSRDDLLRRALELEGVLDAAERLDNLIAFAEENNLVVDAANGWRRYASLAAQRRTSWLRWMVHGYLFIKIPLVRPHRFLATTLPLVEPLFSRLFLTAIAVIGAAGIYLTVRQWDEFMATFQAFYSLQGALVYVLALAVIKVIHEFAHAYTATRYGCRVPTMGVAFLVLFPVLYTDATDAWRLKSHRQRLLIAAAGMIAELILAALATAAWAFLPDGSAKSLAFVVATTGWILSLAVNLNPLLRFDGYYLLSDALGVENLQARSFALGRWKLREWLFGLGVEPPETLPGRLSQTLVVYAWATWIYRLFLFIGIAVLVYYFFFKVLGIALFVIEIVWFIARPLWSELKEWIAMRKPILARPRFYISTSVFATLVAMAIVPFATSVEVPAVIEARGFEKIYPVAPARVAHLATHNGARVSKDQLLLELVSPDIDNRLRIEQINLQGIEQRLVHHSADKKDREQRLVLERQRRLLLDKIAGLERRKALLEVRAPFDGRVVDLNPALHEGRWIGRDEPLLSVVDQSHHVVRGYLAESDLWRIDNGASGKFVPDDVLRDVVPVKVREVSVANTPALDITYLASSYDGPIAVRQADDHSLVPVEAQYLVQMDLLDRQTAGSPVIRGLVRVDGKPESALARLWRRTLQVLVRESGA